MVSSMFSSCTNLVSIPSFNFEKVTSANNFCYGCSKLENVPVFNMPLVTSINQMFGYCYKLTDESLNNIMQTCINATSYTGTKSLNTIGLSTTQITRCQSLSNYQAFLDAGWTD